MPMFGMDESKHCLRRPAHRWFDDILSYKQWTRDSWIWKELHKV